MARFGGLDLTSTTKTALRRARSLARRLRAAGRAPTSATHVEPTSAPTGGTHTTTYEGLYEAHARSTGDDGVGGGDYEVMGEIELDIVRAEGLGSASTLLDFGCGNGRLGVHAVRFLREGTYVGVDIAPTFLAHAAARLAPVAASSACVVRLLHQTDEHFDIADGSVDVACAFSVFTHMEHEDMYRYLVQLRRVVRPGGALVISCLPLDLADARGLFLAEASLDPVARWQRVRNITTSVDLVNAIAALAGWQVRAWYPGDEDQATSETGERRRLGQSIVVLQ